MSLFITMDRVVWNKIYVCNYVCLSNILSVISVSLSRLHTGYGRCLLPARRSKLGICYGNVAGWLAGWLAGCHTPVLYQNG